MTMNIITIDDKEYYTVEDVYVKNKDYYDRCTKLRQIVVVKKLPHDAYKYYHYGKGGVFKVCDGKYPKSSVILLKSWVETNLFITDTVNEQLPNGEIQEGETQEGKIKKGETQEAKTQEGETQEGKSRENESLINDGTNDNPNQTLKVITVNNKEYYYVKDIYNINKAFFYGCAKTLRNIITRKKLTEDLYIFGYYSDDGELIISHKKYCAAKLFLLKEWVDSNVKGVDKSKDDLIMNDIEVAPPKIELLDNEYFKDREGNIIDIMILGYRHKREFYFCLDDVAEKFELPGLLESVSDKRTGYIQHVHYKYFTSNNNDNILYHPSIKDSKKTSHYKHIYLTYRGLIRCLYVSRSKNADDFQDWATDILITHQLGSTNDKMNLISQLTGVNVEAVKCVLKTSIIKIPCLYLFILGTVRELRNVMNIDPKYKDNMYVCKIGKTDNLERRTGEHENFYKINFGCDIELKYFTYVDPLQLSSAESYLKREMSSLNFSFDLPSQTELIVASNRNITTSIKKVFDNVYNLYSGGVKELQSKIKDSEYNLLNSELQFSNKELQLTNELQNKDIIISNLTNEKDKIITNITNEKDKIIANLTSEKDKIIYELTSEKDKIIYELKSKIEIELMEKDKVINDLQKEIQIKSMEKDKIIDQLQSKMELEILKKDALILELKNIIKLESMQNKLKHLEYNKN